MRKGKPAIKIGWNWSDAGAARMGRIVMVRRYDREKWEEYFKT